MNKYEKSLRESSDYRYSAAQNKNGAVQRDRGPGSLSADLKKAMPKSLGKDLDRLDREVRQLDGWTRDLNPNEFVHTPQRFPHSDRADLGDNYVGSLSDQHGNDDESDDRLVLSSEAAMKEPREFETFFGESDRLSKPEFARHHIPAKDLKRIKRDPSLLKYANADDAFGKRSPLDPTMRKVLYGNSDAYQSNKYGALSDVMPSTRQYKRQVSPGRGSSRKRDPLAQNLKQRWRPFPKGCTGSRCDWRPVLEDADKKCNKNECSEVCKGNSCGKKADPVEVCGPLGCTKETPKDEADDPLVDQMEKGGLGTRAVPLLLPFALLSRPASCPCGLRVAS